MRRIILDTNFLMVPYQFKVDIFSELERICHFNYEIYILHQSLNELKGILLKGSGKDKKAAKLALKLVEAKKIKIIGSDNKYVDNLILEKLHGDDIVATQDALLKKRLLKKGLSVIILRKKKYLLLLERKVLH